MYSVNVIISFSGNPCPEVLRLLGIHGGEEQRIFGVTGFESGPRKQRVFIRYFLFLVSNFDSIFCHIASNLLHSIFIQIAKINY